jgi:FKBP-type peptidyl-prolyl cis-trans isomerase SlyD
MSAIIADNHVVTIAYTLRNDAGEVLDASDPGEPLSYLHGVGQIVPGLEDALTGKRAGDALKVSIPPEQAYGVHDPEGVQTLPREAFPPGANIEVGENFQAEIDEDNMATLWITAVEGDQVTVDMNHPLAGETLHFEVSVISIRAASANELAHGHAHGAHGHDHHH